MKENTRDGQVAIARKIKTEELVKGWKDVVAVGGAKSGYQCKFTACCRVGCGLDGVGW